MNENGGKNNTILLTVIAIATLLVVVTGATFAYFAAVVRGNENASSIIITAASKGTQVAFTGGETVNLTNIYPKGIAPGSEWITKNVTLSSSKTNSTGTSKYTFTMSGATNGFDFTDEETKANVPDGTENIKFTFTRDATAKNTEGQLTEVTDPKETATPTSVVASSGAIIGSGIVKNNFQNTVTYVLKVYYDNTTKYNQNNGKQREFSFHIGYTWKDTNDTPVQP